MSLIKNWIILPIVNTLKLFFKFILFMIKKTLLFLGIFLIGSLVFASIRYFMIGI